MIIFINIILFILRKLFFIVPSTLSRTPILFWGGLYSKLKFLPS
jgi:hypothetical protein